MKIAYFDCFSGISGNMILGSLLDAGLSLEKLETELGRLGLDGYRLIVTKTKRAGLAGTHVEVEISETGVARHLHHITDIIQNSSLPDVVKDQSVMIFTRLAQAEAKVHGEPIEHVHFHEVGAMDAIIDVVGSVVGLWLLGVEQVYASPVHVGCGTIECAHGIIPVPAPATTELLKNVPVYGRDVETELVTPTGAAILTTLVRGYHQAPPMRWNQVGYGAGSRELDHPNLLRISLAETSDAINGYDQDVITQIDANIDDMNPEFYEYVMDRLFKAGALDVFLAPIQMKHNRPATKLTILTEENHVAEILSIVFDETSAIGVRTSSLRRWKLQREIQSVETSVGQIEVKISKRGDRILNAKPEYRSCLKAAHESGLSLKTVYQLAQVAIAKQVE